MAKTASLLNVKKHLEHVEWATELMIKDNNKTPDGLVMPLFYASMLKEINFISRCILNKHKAKKSRKDIYVPKN
jgi:hypothetical protein